VLSLTEALAEEVAPLGVTVSTLCPGPTRTEFQARAGMTNASMFKGPFTMDAAPVALEGFQGLIKGKRLVISGPMNKIMVQGLRLSPRRLVTKISGKIAQQK
jgi:uncharacterized protein